MTIGKDDEANDGLPVPGKDKRPRALLDLEATEISSLGLERERAIPDAARGGAADDLLPEVSAGASEPRSRGSPETGAAPREPAEAGPRPSLPEPGETSPHRAGWWRSGIASHLAAALAGGIAALALYVTLAPDVAQRFVSRGDLGVVQRRLEAIEHGAPGPAAAGAGEAFAAAEARIAKLEEGQSRLAGKLGNPDGVTVDARLGKIEAQLTALPLPSPPGPRSHLGPQLAALTSRLSDIEARTAKANEASEAARAAATDAVSTKADVARLDQIVAESRAAGDRNTQAVRGAQESVKELKSTVDGLVAGVEKHLQSAAKPADISAAIEPVSARVAAVEQNLGALLKSEESRRLNAERILVSLELASLKRAIERGASFGRELAEVKAASAGKWPLDALERFSERGVPTLAELDGEFRSVSHAIVDAGRVPAPGSLFERIVAGAGSIVRVRKIDHDAGDTSVEATVSRMAKALDQRQLGNVLDEARKLPPLALQAADPWLDKAGARHAVDEALAGIEAQLKTSLVGSGPASKPAAE